MFINPFLTANIYNQRNVSDRNINVSRPKYSNLAPLAKDTVSFGSTNKTMNDATEGISYKDAVRLYNDAEPAQRYLNRQIDKVLGDLVRPIAGAGSLSKPIKSISKRTKEPESIFEKAATRKWRTYDECKKNMTDIVGARIVMADPSQKGVNAVIERLTDAVKNDRLKIIEIENYRPEPELNDIGEVIKTYDYASPLSLQKLRLECSKKAHKTIKKKDEDRESGYMGIHLLVQLPNGFTGEIQIMGEEVERFKEVEDKCFKVKNKKHLKKRYASVEKMLQPLKDDSDEILQEEHDKYTRKSYLYQRELEMDNNYNKRKNKENNNFLQIPDYLPESLDFNNVAKEIEKCDERAKRRQPESV